MQKKDDKFFNLVCWALLLGYLMQVPLGYSAAFGYMDSVVWAWHREGLAQVFWGKETIPVVCVPIVKQLAGMLGATIACWGVAMAFVVWVPFRRREPWSWWCMLASLLAWTVVDTGLSAYHGAMVNVLFNAFPTVFIGGALVLTYGEVVSAGSSGDSST